MLGIRKTTSPWRWTAHGKHPVASDFFTLGSADSVTKAICEWIDCGYQPQCLPESGSADSRSWRFWLKSPLKNTLAFGILKNSCDHSGRAYPLLLMGSGSLNGWEAHVDLLPAALDKGWNQMEYLMVKRYESLNQIQEAIKHLSPPELAWEKQVDPRPPPSDYQRFTNGSHDSEIARLELKKELLLQLPLISSGELYQQITLWHLLLKSRLKDLPTAVFMGGAVARSFIVIFSRSLVNSDVEKLWRL